MIIKTGWVPVLASLFLVPSVGVLTAQDELPKKPPATRNSGRDPARLQATTEKDPFAIPANATPEELMKFLEGLMTKRPDVETREELIAHITKVSNVMMKVTGVVLDAKDVDDEVAREALFVRFEALEVRNELGDKGAAKQELELAKKYSADSRVKLARLAKEKLLFANLKNVKNLMANDQEKLLEAAVSHVKNSGKLEKKSFQAAATIAGLLEDAGCDVLAAKAYDQFAEMFAHTGDPQLDSAAKTMGGVANRLRLVGHPIEIEGTLANGDQIDWAAYKGKVVLVDFWATWCDACIAEMPNLKSLYWAYHAKGFEIVGVSLDDKQPLLKRFLARNYIPWANLFSADPAATGMEHPLSVKYGVMRLPFTALVGKDGKVIKLDVRGRELREALEELLGPPDKEAFNAALAAEKKARDEEAKAAEEAAKKAKE